MAFSSPFSVFLFQFSVFLSPLRGSVSFCGLFRGFAALHPCLWSHHPFGVPVRSPAFRSSFSVFRSKIVFHHSADAVVGHLAQVVVVGDGAVDLEVAVGDGGQLVFEADVESLGVVTY